MWLFGDFVSFEKTTNEQIYEYVTSRNIISVYQSGFKNNYNKETLVPEITDKA